MLKTTKVALLASSLLIANQVAAETATTDEALSTAKAPEAEMSLAKAAQKSANPVSDVWMFITQNDYTFLETEDGSHEMKNRLSLQPVMPVPIMDGEWNLVNRVVLNHYSVPGSANADDAPNPGKMLFDDRTNGLGDTVVMSLAAPNREDGLIWGVGPTMIIPTATEDLLGQDEWQMGPAALVARLGSGNSDPTSIESWNVGLLAQHWWDINGDTEISQSDIQYFINYKAGATGLIGMTPNIQIDWERDGKDRFTVPVGLGYIGMTKIGPMPVRWGVEAQYYVMNPDASSIDDYGTDGYTPYTPDWNIKFFIAPITMNPFK